MEIALQTQDDMIEMAAYFMPSSEYNSLSDFERYCFSRDLIKQWNNLPISQRIDKSMQIEVYGFSVKTPVWK